MEEDEIQEVKKSLGFCLRLIWSFGIPQLGVRYISKLTYVLFLCLLYSAMFGFLLSQQIAMMFQSGSEDIGTLLSTSLIASVYTFTITILWATRGEDIVQKTILDLAKVDLIIRDFRVIKKDLSLRQGQVLWIGLFLLRFATEVTGDVIRNYNHPKKLLPANATLYDIVAGISSVISHLQLLAFEILFSTIILAIRNRFRQVNRALYGMGIGYDTAKNSTLDKRVNSIVVSNCGIRTKSQLDKLIVELDALYEIHKRLRDMAERFSQVFSFALLLALLTGLISSLKHAFLVKTLTHEKSYTSDIILAHGFTFIYNIVSSWMLVWSCSCLVAEANKSGVLLHRLNASGLTFYKKLRELCMKHHQEKLIIVAGGVLPIDYCCLKLVLFTVTAYAVLIFQQ